MNFTRIASVLALLCLALLAGCSDQSARITERVAYWDQVLATQIPVGTERQRIEAWAESKSIRLSEDIPKHSLHASVEEIPGIGFACSTWYITIQIELGADNRSIRQRAGRAGSCQ